MLPIAVTPAALAVVIADQHAQGYNIGSTHPNAPAAVSFRT